MSIIKAGYRITVDSYENDGDSSTTITVNGLSELEAKFHVELLSLYTSEGGFGNVYDFDDSEFPTEEAYDKARLTILFKPEYKDFILDCVDQNEDEDEDGSYGIHTDCAFNIINDIIVDYTGYSTDFLTRQVEGILVEYVPEEITLEDVTSQFLK